MNILWMIDELLPPDWNIENITRLGDDDWQVLACDGDAIYSGTGETIEDAIRQAARGTRPVGTLFATSFNEEKPKINIMAIISKRLPKMRRLR